MKKKSSPFRVAVRASVKVKIGRGPRAEFVENLNLELRHLNTAGALFGSAIAEQVGLNDTDLKAAELLALKGPLAAGQLAELTGLTTGAITGVVDRLEQAGWARREASPTDRRSVIIRAVPQDSSALAGHYDSYRQSIAKMISDYDDNELQVITEFIQRLNTLTYEQAARLRNKAEEKPKLENG